MIPSIPVKLNVSGVAFQADRNIGVANGAITLPRGDTDNTFSGKNVPFRVTFQVEGSDLRFTRVHFTGKQTLDAMVLAAIENKLVPLIKHKLGWVSESPT